MRARAILAALAATTVTLLAGRAAAQQSARLAILVAEDRRAPAPRDVAVIRAGLHSQDADTCRIAVRALGRLERPALISDIVPLLKSPWPEVRAEAANAIGQAAQGWKAPVNSDRRGARRDRRRLAVEADPGVRAALCQTLSRLPYTAEAQVRRAEAAIIQSLSREDTVAGQLGVAQGLEALIRLRRTVAAPSPDAVATLERLASGTAANGARVRRVAFEALIAARRVTDALIVHGLGDPDAQVRRLALKAIESAADARGAEVHDAAQKALLDESAIVRLEALAAAASSGKRATRVPRYLQAAGRSRRAGGALRHRPARVAAASRRRDPRRSTASSGPSTIFPEPDRRAAGTRMPTRSSRWHRRRPTRRRRRCRSLSDPRCGRCGCTPLARRPCSRTRPRSRSSPPTPTTTSARRRSKDCRSRGA